MYFHFRIIITKSQILNKQRGMTKNQNEQILQGTNILVLKLTIKQSLKYLKY
jgi:hypothetical protein